MVANVQVHKSQEYKYKYILSSSTADTPLEGGEGRRKRAKYGDLSPLPAIAYIHGLFRYTSNSVASITYSLFFYIYRSIGCRPNGMEAWNPGHNLLPMTTRQLYFDSCTCLAVVADSGKEGSTKKNSPCTSPSPVESVRGV